jgi:hypothetical protein
MACFVVICIVGLLTCCEFDEAGLTIGEEANSTIGNNNLTVTNGKMNHINPNYPLTCIALRNEMPRWNITCVDKTKMYFPTYKPEYYYSTQPVGIEQTGTSMTIICKRKKIIVKSTRFPLFKVKPVLDCILENVEETGQKEGIACKWEVPNISRDNTFESSQVELHVSETDLN